MSSANAPELSPQSSITAAADHGVLLSHEVRAQDDFAQAAHDVFILLRAAQIQHPGVPRRLIISIDGHTGDRAGYDPDFFEFQQEFMLGAMGRYFTRIEMPLTGDLSNPEPQDDNIGDGLQVNNPSS
jgi:hypothetical protein